MIPRASFRISPVARITASLLLLAACSEQPLPTGLNPPDPRLDVADASGSYKSGFYWLPPVVAQPLHSGTFDAALSPTVEICELVSGACGTVIATYTTTDGPGGEVVRLHIDEEKYHVNWHTDQFELSTTALYRVSVRAGIYNTLLGYADVQPVSNGSGLKKIDTDEYIGLVDGRTLPIKFRIEAGIVGDVTIEPAEATREPDETQQFVAVLRDLHGNLMTDDVIWASSDEAVATVDQTGLATAIDDGVATITATSERITGSATLTVEAGVLLAVAGGHHSCALTGAGKAYCWGLGTLGQLGNGFTTSRLTPVAVAGGHTFASIDLGHFHSCGITATDEAYCWGRGSSGQLGNGATTNRLTPTVVSGGLTFAVISTASSHTCGITTANQAYCWGLGQNGRLGNGSTIDRLTPVAASGGLAFAAISAGDQHTCGITTANQGYCWGFGTWGQLGNGSFAQRLTPVPIAGGRSWASISSGDLHTCGITTAGQAFCWGDNSVGQLGIGTTELFRSSPVAISGGATFSSISAGAVHTCAITTTGQAFCWGFNRTGRIGNGTVSGPDQRTPVAVAGGLTFTSIKAGIAHTCGVAAAGEVYCWGQGIHGKLGYGSDVLRETPTPVAEFP